MSSKARFTVLDGLRGLAAISVVAYHAGFELHLRGLLTVKAHVAVDLFFCLSGFVLAYAHDEEIRAGALNGVQFLSARLLRFFPVVLLGACLELATSYFVGFQNAAVRDHTSSVFAFSLVLLPVPIDSRLVWIDGVFWSLCIELVVNVAYAALGPRGNDRNVLLVWATSAVVLIACVMWSRSAEMIPYDFSVRSFGALARGFTSF